MRARPSLPPLLFLVLLLLDIPSTLAWGVTLAPGAHDCFNEIAKPNRYLHISWETQPPNDLPIDVQLTLGKEKKKIKDEKNTAQGTITHLITEEAVHTLCLINSQNQTLDVKLTIHVGPAHDIKGLATADDLAPIEERIKRLHKGIKSVRELQDQIREQDTFRNRVTRSTRAWLLWFSVLEAIVLIAISLWQILYLKSFFEVKRIV